LLNVDTTHPTATLVSQILKDYLINSFNETPALALKGLEQIAPFDYNANNGYYTPYANGGGDASQTVANWLLYVVYLNFCLRVESAGYVDALMPALPADRTSAKNSLQSILDDIANFLL
jgi:hypothetical protein